MTQESGATQLVLVGGHESDDGRDLSALVESMPGVSISQAGRPLHNAVSTLLAVGDGPVLVLPMTFGRNPTMVADTAKSLKWLDAGPGAQRLALCEDFGTPDHLVAWLRRAATETARRRPGAALVIAARSANPFDDAELYRMAHLVRAHGAGGEVEVACLAQEDTGLREAVRRVRLLGSAEAVVAPAGFARAMAAPFGRGDLERVEFYGPLMSDRAIRQVITQRSAAAEHRLGHRDSGIEAGLQADHGHGYAHSHSFEEGGHGHSHQHGHPPGHTHGNGHSHAAGRDTDGHRPPRQEPSQEQAASRDEDLLHRH